MQRALKLTEHFGPIRIACAEVGPLRVQGAQAPLAVRILGRPGPEGAMGPPGPQGAPGADGITILPTDAAINGGFF